MSFLRVLNGFDFKDPVRGVSNPGIVLSHLSANPMTGSVPFLICSTGLISLLGFAGCSAVPPSHDLPTDRESEAVSVSNPDTEDASTLTPADVDTWLQESWAVYRQRFIQADGRVIDRESDARTVSEGQAYAMLRAVLIDDPDTFERTLQWAENNLDRPEDNLWAWKWGQQADGRWGITDANFASDADIDAVTALIFAARRWNRPDYLALAQQKLADLWRQSVYSLPTADGNDVHYLMPGPLSAFQPSPGQLYLNPSYLAPYAFRLFAQVDPAHNWMALVDSSYQVLEQSAALSEVGLPADWVLLDLASQQVQTAPAASSLKSQYGFDAYRVWWRVGWDAAWFDEARAKAFLTQNLAYPQDLWQQEQVIAAVMSLQGKPLVDYEATAQYGMLYTAFQQVDIETAAAMRQQKLFPTYRQGIWDNDMAYYVQNLAWLGLFPPEKVPETLLK